MTATMINSSIALFLAIYAIRSKNASSIFLSLFLYISFHYTYAVLPVFSFHFDIYEYGLFHINTQVGVKLTGFGFLIFTLGLLVWRYRQHLFSEIHYRAGKWLKILFMLWGLMVFTQWVIDAAGGDYPSKVAAQDIVSAFLLGIFAWSFSAALQTQEDLPVGTQKNICRLILAVLLIMVAIGSWEIFSFRTFSGVTLASGEHVRRANSLLFNPNVLGFWCAFVAIFAAFTFHSKTWFRKLSTLMLVLAGYGILLSGSRSGLIICLFLLGMVSILLFSVRKRIPEIAIFKPLLIFVTGMGTISLFLKGLDKVTGHTFKRLRTMALLVERFVDVPKQIVGYGFYRFSDFGVLKPSWLSEKMFRSKTTEISIDGRFNAGMGPIDNGYLAMLHDGGWAALVLWIVLWAVLVVLGFKSLRKSPGVNSAYALSLVLGCAFSAVFMRAFQVFPFWVMIAMAMGINLSWFMNVLLGDQLAKKNGNPDST